MPDTNPDPKNSLGQQAINDLRKAWQEAVDDNSLGIPVEDVLSRLERKYQALADANNAAS